MFKKLKQVVVDLEKMRERQAKIRATINELSKLTDKELNDIGINRGDIWTIANGVHHA